MKYSIDRFEGETAVLIPCGTAEEKFIDVPKNQLPVGIKCGSILECINDEYRICEAETQNARNKNTALLNKLKNKKRDKK